MMVKCDFCSDSSTYIVYPIKDFVYYPKLSWIPNFEIQFVDDWLACITCHELIQKKEFEKLAYRANEIDIVKNGSLGFDMDLERYYSKTNLFKLIFSKYQKGDPFFSKE